MPTFRAEFHATHHFAHEDIEAEDQGEGRYSMNRFRFEVQTYTFCQGWNNC